MRYRSRSAATAAAGHVLGSLRSSPDNFGRSVGAAVACPGACGTLPPCCSPPRTSMPRSSWRLRPSPSKPRSTAGAGRVTRSAGAARGSTCGGQPASVSCTSAGCQRRRSGGRDRARTWSRYRLRLDRQNSPLPGTRTVLVCLPRLLLLTRSGPRPVEAVTPRLDAVRRSGPSRTLLRKPNDTTCSSKVRAAPYAALRPLSCGWRRGCSGCAKHRPTCPTRPRPGRRRRRTAR